ncbi:MAG: D-alanyl-D-alanine carboxypeptidase/D-alanyl-D-alanine-endopeptidase [Sphingomonas adhaesiva]|uniref:D-alanyl-D-alanine carboxypeptidase/D-alanyl-D-alanine endopeptidase n=1 Tax=Sphingomonas adhaesiva TaxID=28212 RepID=UPI002FF9DCC1
MRHILLPLLLLATPAAAETVEQALASAPPGTRIGLLVVDADGRELAAVRADERFVPASNTKLFTTAAAFATLDTAAPDVAGGATVRLEGRDVVLAGHGDARLSSAADCTADCLAELARAVVARTRTVRDVIGDDTAFPDERWPAGMSWNNIPGRYGTAISALTLDDNVTTLTVDGAGKVSGDGYYRIDGRVDVTTGGEPSLGYARLPGSDRMTVTGTIPAGHAPVTLTVGVDDPAHRAAWRFVRLLRAAGVRVTGTARVRHRAVTPADDPATRGQAPVARAPEPVPLARLTPGPLAEDVRLTNKVSQNLHADLLLRRVGRVTGSGSVADGQAVVAALLDKAGVARAGYDFSDGSGMSSYNRISPRSAVALLRWAATQPWGAAWRETLPVGGVDGTLARRFAGTPLDGKLFAKTGTLNAANALSGYLIAASGRTLTFSALANDMADDASATAAIDRALLAIATAN